MAKGLSRRDALRQGAGLLGGAALAGMPLSRALAQGAARVRFAGYVESQEQLTQTLAVLKLYSERHPDVEIIPEFTNFGAFTDKIATETAGGNAPDMFSVNVDLLAEYARRGVTMPLDQYIPDPIDLSSYLQSAVDAAKFDGKQFAIPNDAIAPAVFINQASFEKAGVPIPPEMWTWEQLSGGRRRPRRGARPPLLGHRGCRRQLHPVRHLPARPRQVDVHAGPPPRLRARGHGGLVCVLAVDARGRRGTARRRAGALDRRRPEHGRDRRGPRPRWRSR